MKQHRRPSPILYLLNSYHGGLLIYLILRLIFGSRWWWLGVLHTFAFWLFLPLLISALLALFLRGKRTVAIALFLLLIGILRFAPLPIGHLTASDKPHDLRVLTFNVWIHNPQIEETINWVLAQDADVLILQEFVGAHLNQLPRLLENYPYQEFVAGNVRVLSRFPFIESQTIWIQDPVRFRDGRLAVRTVIDLNGQAVTIYGIHLSLPTRETPHFGIRTGIDTLDFILRYDETHRNNQIRNLSERIESENNPVILAGDFNTSHTSPILGNLSALGMTDAFRAVGTGWGMTWMHSPPDLPLIRIDYVWSSPQLTPLRMQTGNFIGSDHLPLVIDYVLN